MFERRLAWLGTILSLLALLIVARLVDIQVIHAAQFVELSDRLLTRPVRYLPAPRGPILDRNGVTLAADRPTYDVTLMFPVLKEIVRGQPDRDSQKYLEAVARELRKRGRLPAKASTEESVTELRRQLRTMWSELPGMVGCSAELLQQRADAVVRRVERIRESRVRRTGIDEPVREEQQYHAVAAGLGEERALRARLELDRYPWLDVVPSSVRDVSPSPSLVHALGRLGAADDDRIGDDPLRGDELRRLRPGDECGVNGAEWLGEPLLRGTRGRVVEDFDRQELERQDPVPGSALRLSLDSELQAAVLEMLRQAVESSANPAGGAAVVLDAQTREVLALVSFPTYSPEEFDRDYDRLRRDWRWQPLRFRAVSNQYPPGSTCKAITLYGALADGKISPNERVHCSGMFMPSQPNQFRCWIYNEYPGVTHDLRGDPAGQNASDAVRNSCNIYFYTLGDRLGPQRLCEWFDRFGIGRLAGAGLLEEADGISPNDAWLRRNRPSEPEAQRADAWNWAIGQGEVGITPLQAANVAATIAEGRWAPVRLALDAIPGSEPGAIPVGPELDARWLTVLREGMWRVVNERGGTAHGAKLETPGYVMCGKTGSAQTVPRVLDHRFTLEWPDGRREVRVGQFEEDVLAGAGTPPPRIVGRQANRRFPEVESLSSHAWFIGYTQRDDTSRGGAPRGRCYAISVIIEFGGSGGRVAGPVARQIAEYLLRSEREWG